MVAQRSGVHGAEAGLFEAVDSSLLILLTILGGAPPAGCLLLTAGTMSHVDPGVYTRLMGDVVRLVVLPRTDRAEPCVGGFVCIGVEAEAWAP